MNGLRYTICVILSIVLLSVDGRVFLDTDHDFVENIQDVWQSFKDRFSKRYADSQEEDSRLKQFLQNLELVKGHNIEARLGLRNFTLDLNEFADWTREEYLKYLNGLRIPANAPSDDTAEEKGDIEEEIKLLKRDRLSRRFNFPWRPRFNPDLNPDNNGDDSDGSLPSSVDWRTKGWVTPVKNQGKCGSCWAFSATGALEAQNMNKTGKLVSLSEQNLVDCSKDNMGCNGGVPEYAFRYVRSNGGIDSEQSYPYTGQDGTCKYKSYNSAAMCSGWRSLPSGSESALQWAVANIGPVTVGIDASSYRFQLYKQGVFSYSGCSSSNIDHAVLVVGYGSQNGQPYWIVKNSWGTGWGQDGYVLMARNSNNMCGIATMASVPFA